MNTHCPTPVPCGDQIRDEEMREKSLLRPMDRFDPGGWSREPIAVDLLTCRSIGRADYSTQIEKLAAIKKYQDALKAVASAHQKLYDQRNKWNSAQLSVTSHQRQP